MPEQRQHRNDPGTQVYRGPGDYRTGTRPPVEIQRRDGAQNRGQYRNEYRAERRFRIRPYIRPRGWYLREWTLGAILPRLFWTESYWLRNYWEYGLPVPPYGCIWVRYDNDALLIDQRSGQVVQVIYDIFY